MRRVAGRLGGGTLDAVISSRLAPTTALTPLPPIWSRPRRERSRWMGKPCAVRSPAPVVRESTCSRRSPRHADGARATPGPGRAGETRWLPRLPDTIGLTGQVVTADTHPAHSGHDVRGHWLETTLHRVRDVTYREDQSRARTGVAPRTMAGPRYQHHTGWTTITAGLPHTACDPNEPSPCSASPPEHHNNFAGTEAGFVSGGGVPATALVWPARAGERGEACPRGFRPEPNPTSRGRGWRGT